MIKAERCEAPESGPNHEKGDPGYKVVYPDGYESWSPKDVFEEAYKEIESLTYNDAVEMLNKAL